MGRSWVLRWASGRNELDGEPEKRGEGTSGKGDRMLLRTQFYTTPFRRGLDNIVLRLQLRGECSMLPTREHRVRSLVGGTNNPHATQHGQKNYSPIAREQMNRGEFSPDGTGCQGEFWVEMTRWELSTEVQPGCSMQERLEVRGQCVIIYKWSVKFCGRSNRNGEKWRKRADRRKQQNPTMSRLGVKTEDKESTDFDCPDCSSWNPYQLCNIGWVS